MPDPQAPVPSLPQRALRFLWETKWFWLPPILLALGALAFLYYLAGSSDVVAPFVYDLQ